MPVTGASRAAAWCTAAGEMVRKTTRTGVSLFVAISGVTGLAIDAAQCSGVALRGFARGPDLSVHGHA